MDHQTNCTSYFKNGSSVPEKEIYTQIWISLINQMEQAKAVLAGA